MTISHEADRANSEAEWSQRQPVKGSLSEWTQVLIRLVTDIPVTAPNKWRGPATEFRINSTLCILVELIDSNVQVSSWDTQSICQLFESVTSRD